MKMIQIQVFEAFSSHKDEGESNNEKLKGIIARINILAIMIVIEILDWS